MKHFKLSKIKAVIINKKSIYAPQKKYEAISNLIPGGKNTGITKIEHYQK